MQCADLSRFDLDRVPSLPHLQNGMTVAVSHSGIAGLVTLEGLSVVWAQLLEADRQPEPGPGCRLLPVLPIKCSTFWAWAPSSAPPHSQELTI